MTHKETDTIKIIIEPGPEFRSFGIEFCILPEEVKEVRLGVDGEERVSGGRDCTYGGL